MELLFRVNAQNWSSLKKGIFML